MCSDWSLPEGHPLVGSTLGTLRWPERYHVQVLAVDADPDAVRARHRARRDLGRSKALNAATVLEHDDRLVLQGHAEAVAALAADVGLPVEPVDPTVLPGNLAVVEVLPPPRSRWLGHSLRELAFRDRYGLQVVGVRRGGASVTEGLAELRLRFGDTLLVQGPLAAIDRLKRERGDAVVLAEPNGGAVSQRAARRAPVAIAIMLAMLVVMTTGWLPTVVAVGLAAIAMVATGCLSMEEAYRAINWESVVLIAGVLPMATALDATGGMRLVVDALVAGVGPYGPLALLAGLFVLTSLASQVISNTATAVLLAPIAFQARPRPRRVPVPVADGGGARGLDLVRDPGGLAGEHAGPRPRPLPLRRLREGRPGSAGPGAGGDAALGAGLLPVVRKCVAVGVEAQSASAPTAVDLAPAAPSR